MPEVEALCNKLVIMANGVFRCIGSLSRIKELYGKGFDLYVKFSGVEELVLEGVQRLFEDAPAGQHDGNLQNSLMFI